MSNKSFTISYSDSSCQSGIQSDLSFFQHYHTFGFSAIHSTKRHNGTLSPIDPTIIKKQIETVLAGGIPDSTKIDSLPNQQTATLLTELIHTYQLKNIVIDPIYDNSTNYASPSLLACATILCIDSSSAMNLTHSTVMNTIDELKQTAFQLKKLGPKTIIIHNFYDCESNNFGSLFYDGDTYHYIVQTQSISQLHPTSYSVIMTAQLANGVSPLDSFKHIYS
ncbi:MAG: bifunctional hydroxymethylpyrimidine kinase/phosphomethylpyrimidine kinase [Vagococcus sp.]